MAMSFTRPDPGNPAQVAEASFSTARRGFDQNEVREFLQTVALEMSRLTERVRFLEREVDAAQNSPDLSARLDEETLTRLLGEETARVLSAARTSATEIREKAEHAAAQLVGEANDEAARLRDEVELEVSRRRTDAAADSEAELEMAKQQGREMVNEARAYRERVLSELSRRRELARAQIEQLVHGRDRLIAAFEQARVAAVDVMADLEPLGEPGEYVNLTPTTGPVPVMVARDDEPGDVTVDEDDVAVQVETDQDDEAGDEAEAEVDVAVEVGTGQDDEAGGAVSDEADVAERDCEGDDTETQDDEVRNEVEIAEDEAALSEPADVVVDLFARLRSATDDADRTDDDTVDHADEGAAAVDDGPEEPGDAADAGAAAGSDASVAADEPGSDHDADGVTESEDGPFEQRDAQLTPLIVASARKLKRVLADEQNDVLDALRQAGSVSSIDELVPAAPEQSSRYADAIGDDLLLAAQAGAAATDAENVVTLKRAAARRCVDAAGEHLAERLIGPLRERLERAVSDADGDLDALTKKVRAVYREVKTRQIDDVLDDVFLSAHGAGFYAAVPDGAETVWLVDKRQPGCPDGDDNALSPPVVHGDEFPTGHVSTPAHPGCRCMLHICPR